MSFAHNIHHHKLYNYNASITKCTLQTHSLNSVLVLGGSFTTARAVHVKCLNAHDQLVDICAPSVVCSACKQRQHVIQLIIAIVRDNPFHHILNCIMEQISRSERSIALPTFQKSQQPGTHLLRVVENFDVHVNIAHASFWRNKRRSTTNKFICL